MEYDSMMLMVRRPAVAGQFYPGDARALRDAVLEACRPPLGPGALPEAPTRPRRLLGVMCPHAGYQFSAQGAAWSFAEMAAEPHPGAVVLLGVNHRDIGAPIALSPATGWETPLGIMPVGTALGETLRSLDEEIIPDTHAHQYEHSLEVQVPFLQVLFGEIPIIPIVLGHPTTESVMRLGQALAELAREQDLLIIASSDMSHYLPQREAEVLDRLALQRVAAVDAAGLLDVVRQRRISMCGVMPVAALLAAAATFDGHAGKILHYHTSGDVTGDRQEVVGYGAAAIYRTSS